MGINITTVQFAAFMLQLSGSYSYPMDYRVQVRPDDPRLIGHPMLAKPDWKRRAVPLMIWGDGGAFTRAGNSIMLLCVAFMLMGDLSRESVFPVSLFCKFNRARGSVHGVGNDAWDRIWKYAVHGLNALFDGYHPLKDPWDNEWSVGSRQWELAGEPIANGLFFGVMWVATWDQDYGSNELGLDHYNGNKICCWCPANRSNYNFRDVSKNAPYKKLHYKPGPADVRVSVHEIWGIRGLTRFHYSGDEMHASALGVLLDLHGSAIADAVDSDIGFIHGGTYAQRVDIVWADIHRRCREQNVAKTMSVITATMLGKQGKFPCLRAKAAESKSLVTPMLSFLLEKAPNTMHWKHVKGCYRNIAIFYEVIVGAGHVLSDEQADRVVRAIDRFMLHFNSLTNLASDRGIPRYNFTGKLHVLYHIAEFARFLNPRMTWTYQFEDFMGHMIKLGHACSLGTPGHLIPAKMMQHYMLILSHLVHGDFAWQA